MRVVHIVPGSGGTFYCENCMRDAGLVRALRAQGHDVIMVPMYLPMFTDGSDPSSDTPVFFGGINVYLQQNFPIFRRLPRWLGRMFDAHWILKLVAKRGSSVRATGLGPMTLSMICGEDGNQAEELDRLISWLTERDTPDVVHLSNALLIGLAHRIRQELKVPVVCSLQDEDTWVDAMDEPYRTQCWEAMSARCSDIDMFVSVSHFYAERVRARLGLTDDKLRVVHIGVEEEAYREAPLSFNPPVIGYLSRLSESLGLGVLVDAFIQLKEDPRFKDVRLHATGGQTSDDSAFLTAAKRKLTRAGLSEYVTFLPEFGRDQRLDFLASLSLMSVPLPEGEAYGLFAVEAMASGVPLVEPRNGAFPELIEEPGAGILYEPNTVEALTEALALLLTDPQRTREMGKRARTAFFERFTIKRMASEMEKIYEAL